MKAGSAAQVLLAWEEPERLHRGLQGARFTATALSGVRRRGWAQSIGEREPGVASVSAPVRGPSNRVVAAVSVSGPIERLTRHPGRMHAQAVIDAAARLSRGPAPHRLTCRRTTGTPQLGTRRRSQPRPGRLASTPRQALLDNSSPRTPSHARAVRDTSEGPPPRVRACWYPRPDSNRRYRLERAAC